MILYLSHGTKDGVPDFTDRPHESDRDRWFIVNDGHPPFVNDGVDRLLALDRTVVRVVIEEDSLQIDEVTE